MINSKECKKVILACQKAHGKLGTFFRMDTFKRENDEARTFNASFAIEKYIVGTGGRYDLGEKNLMLVRDQKRYSHYLKTGKPPLRTVNCNHLMYLQVCGEVLVDKGRKTARYYYYLDKVA